MIVSVALPRLKRDHHAHYYPRRDRILDQARSCRLLASHPLEFLTKERWPQNPFGCRGHLGVMPIGGTTRHAVLKSAVRGIVPIDLGRDAPMLPLAGLALSEPLADAANDQALRSGPGFYDGLRSGFLLWLDRRLDKRTARCCLRRSTGLPPQSQKPHCSLGNNPSCAADLDLRARGILRAYLQNTLEALSIPQNGLPSHRRAASTFQIASRLGGPFAMAWGPE